MHKSAVSAGMLNIDQLLAPRDCGDRMQASQAFLISWKVPKLACTATGGYGFVHGTLSTLHIYIDHSPSILGLHILSGAYCSAELLNLFDHDIYI